MGSLKPFSLFTYLIFTFFVDCTNASIFDILNNCSYTVWAAAVPGGGRNLDRGQTWTLDVGNSTAGVYRIWARTGCSFDGAGRGKCQTGDCNGLLQCQGYGTPPNTLAEFALNQFNNMDLFDLSLIDGFNVPMGFSPNSETCSGTQGVKCTGDINGDCPNELRVPGGCNHPCTVFGTNQYCCYSGPCIPTGYLRLFRDKCPDAYSYPRDGAWDKYSYLPCRNQLQRRVLPFMNLILRFKLALSCNKFGDLTGIS